MPTSESKHVTREHPEHVSLWPEFCPRVTAGLKVVREKGEAKRKKEKKKKAPSDIQKLS